MSTDTKRTGKTFTAQEMDAIISLLSDAVETLSHTKQGFDDKVPEDMHGEACMVDRVGYLLDQLLRRHFSEACRYQDHMQWFCPDAAQ